MRVLLSNQNEQTFSLRLLAEVNSHPILLLFLDFFLFWFSQLHRRQVSVCRNRHAHAVGVSSRWRQFVLHDTAAEAPRGDEVLVVARETAFRDVRGVAAYGCD